MNAAETTGNSRAYDIVILGAGYAGLMAALRLDRKKETLRIALINASDQFLERVRLQESIVTEVTPRIHSAFLTGSNIEFICGSVTSLDADRRCIRIYPAARSRSCSIRRSTRWVRVDVNVVPGAAARLSLEAAEGLRSPSALRARLRESADQPICPRSAAPSIGRSRGRNQDRMARQVAMISSSRCGDFKGARVKAPYAHNASWASE
jgi:monoamine oxidase